MSAVIGIDPGARETGIVLAEHGRLVEYKLVRRSKADGLLDVNVGYLADINVTVAGMAAGRSAIVACEGLVKPNPHVGMTDPSGAMATAMVIGALVMGDWQLVIVPPEGNGSLPFGAYPVELRPKAGGKGSDLKRHLRSAWDVARVARQGHGGRLRAV
jgi:hypothetical protein